MQQCPAEWRAAGEGGGIGQHRFELCWHAEGRGLEDIERRLVGEDRLEHLVLCGIEESFSFNDEQCDGDRADAIRAMRIRKRGIAREH